MDDIGRGWDRHQWVGDPANRAASKGDAGDDVARWSLDQWVGESAHGGPRRRWRPAEVDTAGGFSGFGQADGGGQRWAMGYTQQVVVPVVDRPEIEPSRASS
jgi:hypothetical protein